MQFIFAILTALFQFLPLPGAADAQLAGQALAQQATYVVYAIPGSEQRSVKINFPLEDAPYLQLYAPAVLRAFTHAALELQQSPVETEDGAEASAQAAPLIFMDARHIAGETELHLAGYAITYLTGGAGGIFPELHERFRVVDLNIDENRFPPGMIDFVGWLMGS
jgi:hypothetical protein